MNSARLDSDQSFVPLTPNHTAALGVLYNQGPLQNITNRHDIYFLNGYTSGATPAGYVNGNPLVLPVART